MSVESLKLPSLRPSSLIVILRGSIRNWPASPLAALATTEPKTSTCSVPETSTKPPSPETLPPLASMSAPSRKSAVSGEYTMTSPPSPLTPAFAVVTL